MRKWGLWATLFIVVLAIALITGWRSDPLNHLSYQPISLVDRSTSIAKQPFQRSSEPNSQTATSAFETETPSDSRPLPKPAPRVDTKRLFSHLEALGFERYTESDRAYTRDYLAQELKKAGWSPQIQPFESGVNLWAERPGTDPTAGAILVGAHYDTVERSPGADDNASGVAAVLEVARLLGQRDTTRTLRVAFFDQEEQGLFGSLAFTAEPSHVEDLKGAIILEMIGYACHKSGCQHYPAGLPTGALSDRGDFVAVIGDQEHMPLLQAFRHTDSHLPDVATLPVPLKGMLTPALLRSDHAPFWYKDVGAVMVTDTANFRTPYYHQPSDLPEEIDQKFFAGVTQLVVNVVTNLLDSQDNLMANVSSSLPQPRL